MTVTAHFDGRVFVPDGPVDLPVGRKVRVVVEPDDEPAPVGSPPDVRAVLARRYQSGHTDTAARHDEHQP